MELTLGENIRALRKQRKLTQEQLAEVLGVTTGAVYKWESGLSVPEITLIMEMADFFDTSVDVILGYKMKDNSIQSTIERLERMMKNLDMNAPSEIEKALKKYPNSFEIVYASAVIYMVIGMESHNKETLVRSLELYEQSILLISQNTNPKISECIIYGKMGSIYIELGEKEKGLEIMKKHNVGGMFNDSIGTALAIFLDRPDEAIPFLNEAIIDGVSTMVNSIASCAMVYGKRGDYKQAKDIIIWGLQILQGVNREEKASFTDKMYAMFLTILAQAQLKTGEKDEAVNSLKQVCMWVEHFDAAPDYSFSSRFADMVQDDNLGFDGLGITARESVKKIIEIIEDDELEAMWKEVSGNDGD
ncbi:MAG: helix-turn-helix transcriptional regulator [Erysipelotrichaceae bacterium]|nr:helix-turn-helix transcriptional regulator [Erysipelotrichaceae bacterium]